MIIVSDTSPISNLIILDQLFVLPSLFNDVIIPLTVKEELNSWSGFTSEVKVILAQSWLSVQECKDQTFVSSLRQKVDHGEAEAIALAVELKADRLLIDDRDGRRLAESLGVDSVGLMGVLIEARKRNLIPSLKDSLNHLVKRAGFRMSESLIAFALKQVAEV